MLLAKEDNLPTDYLHRNMPDQSKSSSYMPPIKSSSKHFLSPSQFQSVKRLPPFSYQQTPKKEYNNQIKLEVLSLAHLSLTLLAISSSLFWNVGKNL